MNPIAHIVRCFYFGNNLKVCSLISYRGHFAFLLEINFSKGICRYHLLMKLGPFLAKILVSENLFNKVVYGAGSMHIIIHVL